MQDIGNLMESTASNRSYVTGVILVLVLACLFRVVYVNDGLPFRYQIDENNRMYTIEEMLSENSLNPHWFGHPAQTVIYPVAALASATYLAGRLSGKFNSRTDFAEWYHKDPSFIYMLARSFMLLVSLAVILVSMQLARRLFNNRAAFIAGAVLALSPAHIYYSPLIRSSDIVMSLFLLLCTFPMLDILRKKDNSVEQPERSIISIYALAGICVGLAVASKYYGVLTAVGVLTAHLFAFGPALSKIKYLFIALLFSLLAAFIAGPYLFLDFMTVLKSVAGEARSSHLSATAPGFFEDIVWFAQVIWRQAIGAVLLGLAMLGMVVSLVKNKRQTIVVLAAPVAILLFLAAMRLRWPRWTLVFLPFLAIFSGLAADFILKYLEQRLPTMRARLAAAMLLFGAFYWSLSGATNMLIERQKTDARDIAYEWINDNIPTGSKLFVEMYGPQLNIEKYSLLSTEADSAAYINPDQGGFINHESRNILGSLESLDILPESGIEYVVLTNFEDRYRDSRFAEKYAERIQKYEELRERAVLLYDTSALGEKLRGKKVLVFELTRP